MSLKQRQNDRKYARFVEKLRRSVENAISQNEMTAAKEFEEWQVIQKIRGNKAGNCRLLRKIG